MKKPLVYFVIFVVGLGLGSGGMFYCCTEFYLYPSISLRAASDISTSLIQLKTLESNDFQSLHKLINLNIETGIVTLNYAEKPLTDLVSSAVNMLNSYQGNLLSLSEESKGFLTELSNGNH
jgi:hypothetical protein